MKTTLMALIASVVICTGAQNATPAGSACDLPRFDFEFQGGSPKELVAALNIPLRGKLNVILSDESENARIPSVKVKDANVSQIFEALSRASLKPVYYDVRAGSRNELQSASEQVLFETTSPISENSVWSLQFLGRRPPPSVEKSVRFYQLEPYLNGLKVEDVVTAIQTAWKMAGRVASPELKYHPETRLLIAVGNDSDFSTIDAALRELPKKTEPRKESLPREGILQDPKIGRPPPPVK